MALFIAQLAFTDIKLLAAAKLGILVASGIAAIGALILGQTLLASTVDVNAAKTEEEAESATNV
jgi:NhaA family Na+:H+ antiporter